ncbi:MAG: alpha/beta hydrolase family protein [Verrucomicrobia bacterium]|nr:alpha/beta hydrolase family protein [Verrucomicrobiota bacterium]
MHAALTKPLDRLAIRLGWSSVRRSPVIARSAAELAAALSFSDWTAESAGAPADIAFTERTAFHFSSPLATPWPENNTAHGRLFPCGTHWCRQPTVVLLHGWNGELQFATHFPYWARKLRQVGVNAAMIELPYHGRRRPRGPGAVRNFISGDVLRVLEATRQALADVRALVAWLAGQGCPAVGLWGVSLGAWLSGLLACAEPRVQFVVLLSPVADIERAVGELAFCEPIRRGLANTPLPLSALNLATQQPKLPADRILILKSEHDLLAPAQTIEGLWEAWHGSELWRLPHGHISVLLDWGVLERTVRWIGEKAVAARGDGAPVASRCPGP